MKRELAIALAVGVAAVLAASWAGVALGLRAHDASLQQRAERAAHALRLSYQGDARAIRLQMQQICTRDAQVERLALELAAGGSAEAEASRTALGLSRVLGTEVWLLLQRSETVLPIGASAALPEPVPALASLRAGSTLPQLLMGTDAPLVASCARAVGKDELWIVRTEPLARARVRWLSVADTEAARFVDSSQPGGAAEDRADVLALELPGSAPQEQRMLRLRVAEPPHFDQLLALLPLFVTAVGLLGALAYTLQTRGSIDDTVLVELEQAADRVARGDLTARIGPRAAGRADQTFRTFDRMTAELSDMRTRLADAERAAAWQDMARRIAHEIKNPLSPIRIAIETLRKAHDKQLPVFDEIFDESTRAILEEVRRMEHIVREFSEFARLPRARPGALDLSALVADTVALYQPADVSIEVVSEQPEIALRADREQLAQVLVNLIQNATDAARTSHEPRVRITLEADRSTVWVHVDDNGPGIQPADRERVFEPYYTTKDHGTGLGLAIVKRIAADHEGTIVAANGPLGGARFTLRLPRVG